MTTPGSGNRWEPAAGTTPMPDDTAPSGSTGAPASSGGTRRTWRDRLRPGRIWRGRAWLVGVAAAFLLLGGVAGFFLGHTTAGHGTEVGRFGRLDHRGPGPGFHHDGFGPDGFGHGGFGHGEDGAPR